MDTSGPAYAPVSGESMRGRARAAYRAVCAMAIVSAGVMVASLAAGVWALALLSAMVALPALLALASIHRVRAAVRRIERRVIAGWCPACGADLGGQLDRPCPYCHAGESTSPRRSPETPEEKRAWLLSLPRRERRLLAYTRATVKREHGPLYKPPNFAIIPSQGSDGSLTFEDRISPVNSVVAAGVLALVGGGLAVGLAAVANSSAGGWIDPVVLAGLGAILAILGPLGLLTLRSWRRARSTGRTVVLRPHEGRVEDTSRSRGESRTVEGALPDVWFTVSEVGNGRFEAVVLWAPGGPLFLAQDERERRITEYVDRFPAWLRAREAIEPAAIELG